ncbi:Uncharacterized protein SCF082_LOCUS32588 [Durusdinium trenchii]|uniref:Uncharacterized protein n=1 Tax=Durusdinium trenchii TaxID=1381693 RepID=A0ABP0NIN8_9DINO
MWPKARIDFLELTGKSKFSSTRAASRSAASNQLQKRAMQGIFHADAMVCPLRQTNFWRGIVASVPKLSAHVLLHLLLLRATGLLGHDALRPMCHTMLEALESSGIQGPSHKVHESGYRGRQLPKEAHTVAKVLVRLGGYHAPEPLRRPWIYRHAALGVHLLLPSSWSLDEGGLQLEE